MACGPSSLKACRSEPITGAPGRYGQRHAIKLQSHAEPPIIAGMRRRLRKKKRQRELREFGMFIEASLTDGDTATLLAEFRAQALDPYGLLSGRGTALFFHQFARRPNTIASTRVVPPPMNE